MKKEFLVAGVDEVGLGCLAGPVYAAAVILDPRQPIEGLADSKQLTPLQREKLTLLIKERSLAWAVAFANVEEIEQLNILQASLLAMKRAVSQLSMIPDLVKVDGRHAPALEYKVETLINGDQLEPAISAASIIAKVTRDQLMRELDLQYPGYGFASHKGYSTQTHLLALRTKGATQIHRRTYAPVRAVLEI